MARSFCRQRLNFHDLSTVPSRNRGDIGDGPRSAECFGSFENAQAKVSLFPSPIVPMQLSV